ncbi:cell surface glycoprotein CD200 receptor 1-like [Astyanax mexicanus]|uniref:Cell surface glycoprotein CD200 receptor 1-like n=1 Tax=Astyanax mexicanus TaxID=7994 RepID=A0A8T2LLC0_ASTMX|nr:cell surface glycoprotein CD200 receptor 1-like [Astyanax mexicanus]
MENMWMLGAVLALSVCLTSGSRNESVEMGTNITLLCTNEKVEWNKMIYVIWKIYSQEKNCSISVSTSDPAFNNCTDGKQIINESTSGNYSLFIPQFSSKDEGRYICDMSYQAGAFIETINVYACVRPTLTGWLEKDEDGHTFAVCEAQSKPAASIYWKTQWKISSLRTSSSKNDSGLFTVTSRLQLPHDASYNNLTCVVSASPSKCWKEIQFTFQYKVSFQAIEHNWIRLGIFAFFIITLLIIIGIVLVRFL